VKLKQAIDRVNLEMAGFGNIQMKQSYSSKKRGRLLLYATNGSKYCQDFEISSFNKKNNHYNPFES